jgi:hypothetical protein
LGFHLELLKSLYVQKEENDDDNDNLSRNCAIAGTLSSQQQQQAETKEKWDDGPIDPSIWKMGEFFLIQRSSLLRKKQEAARLQGIHQETIVLWKKETAFGFSKKNSTGVSTTDAAVCLSSNIGVCIRLFFLTLPSTLRPLIKPSRLPVPLPLALSRVYSSVDPKAPTRLIKSRFIPFSHF